MTTHKKNAPMDIGGEKYKEWINKSPYSVYIYSTRQGVLFSLEKFHQLLGLEPNTLKNDPYLWHKLLHPEDLARLKKESQDLKPGDTFSIEYRVKGKDGNWYWFMDQVISITRQQDEMIIEGMVSDITERKRTGNQLIQSEDRYKNFISQVSDGVYRFELHQPMPVNLPIEEQIDFLYEQMYIAECNPAFMKMYGLKDISEILGKSQIELHGGIDNPTDRQAMRSFIENGYRAENVLTEEVDADDQVKYFNNNSLGIIKDGYMVRMWGTQTDITQQKLSEQKILVSENKYRKALENIQLIGIMLDINADLVFVNDYFLNLTGWKQQDVLGKNWFDLFVPGEIDDEIKKVFKKTLIEDKVVSSYTNNIVTRNGNQKTIKWSNITYYDELGKPASVTSIGENITEKLAAELALQKSETFLKTLVKSLPDMIWLKNPQGVYRFCNARFEKFFGAKEADIIGKTDYDYMDKKQADFFRKHDEAAIKAGKPRLNEEEVTFASDGHHEFLETIKTPMFDANGSLLGVLGIARNISELKETQKFLEKAKNRFDLAMDASQDGLFDWDLITNEIYYSPGWKRMLGYEPDELPADLTAWEKLTDPNDTKRTMKLQRELLSRKRERFETEFKMKHKDGHWVDILARAKAFYDKSGKAVRIVGTHVDISQRKKAETELKESEERFKTLHNASFGGIGIHDKGVMLECNQGLLQMTGYSYEEMIGMDGLLLVAEESREMVKEKMASGDEKPYEVVGIRKNGEKYHLRIAAKNIPYKGKTVRVGEFRDITDQKKAEQELRESEERYKTLHNASFGGIVIHEKGLILECNKGLSEITGFDYEELIGMDGLLLISDDTRPQVVENIKNGYEKPYEVIGVRKNGDSYPLRLEARIIPYKGKQVRVVEFRDISEQKKAEQELRESEEKYRTLINSANEEIFFFDTVGKSIDVNQFACEKLGYNKEELLKMGPMHIDSPEFAKTVPQTFERILKEGQLIFESAHQRKDGSAFPVEVSARVLKFKGAMTVIAFARDISDRKRAEAELAKYREHLEELVEERTQKLQARNEELEAIHKNIIGREFRIKELRDQVQELKKRLGEE